MLRFYFLGFFPTLSISECQSQEELQKRLYPFQYLEVGVEVPKKVFNEHVPLIAC